MQINPMEPSLSILLLLLSAACGGSAAGGHWELLQRSIGVSAMHMQLLHNDKVIIFDRTDFGRSNLSLPFGRCRDDPSEMAIKHDCTAHSVEYDVPSNTFRALTVLTDTWCSSGTVAPDGTLIQTGGFNDGDRAARRFTPCNGGSCDWVESRANNDLAVRRWYATNQILPDGRAVVVGGRGQFSYEFYPKSAGGAVPLPFLQQTTDVEENNLYPFVHLNVDGHLFIFANNRAILLDYTTRAVIRTYPSIPGGDPRNYPSSGSSVLLPLHPPWTEAEVLICGGAPAGSFLDVRKSATFAPALSSCARMRITDPSPSWSVEAMPVGRVMGDMVLLPTGQVLLVNGAGAGTAGWESSRNPVKSPAIYTPGNPAGARFAVQNSAAIPRLYHSTAILLRDGRVLIGGSNPHISYRFTGVEYPTELSLEAFSPDYLGFQYSNMRPRVVSLPPPAALGIGYGGRFRVRFQVGALSGNGVRVTMVAPAFATHAISMSQRLLVLEVGRPVGIGEGVFEVVVAAPPTRVVAPPGYYMVFVVNGVIPSKGVWVHIG